MNDELRQVAGVSMGKAFNLEFVRYELHKDTCLWIFRQLYGEKHHYILATDIELEDVTELYEIAGKQVATISHEIEKQNYWAWFGAMADEWVKDHNNPMPVDWRRFQ